jgi:putative ABC transport system permease protein
MDEGLFAGLAMTLAIAAIYGVISYAVAARTRQFGIRFWRFGADKSQMFRLVLRHGSMLLASGLLLGAAGGIALTRTLKSFMTHLQN